MVSLIVYQCESMYQLSLLYFLGIGLSPVICSWHLTLSPPDMGRRETNHKISLRHAQLTGHWILCIDGLITQKGKITNSDRAFLITFRLMDKAIVILCNGQSSLKYKYFLQIEGQEYPHLGQVAVSSLGEKAPKYVTVPKVSSRRENGSVVTFYELQVETPSIPETHLPAVKGYKFTIERRFSEFVLLDAMIRSQTESHLVDSLPKLPTKFKMPFSKQTDEEFIESRRQSVESYMRFLLANEKILHYTEFMCFLGLHPITGDPLEQNPKPEGSNNNV